MRLCQKAFWLILKVNQTAFKRAGWDIWSKIRIMQNASEIYAHSIRQLPTSERLRLATLILEDLTAEQLDSQNQPNLSALELIEDSQNNRIFQNADEVDEYLKAERESWER